jgi:hypothetical protein
MAALPSDSGLNTRCSHSQTGRKPFKTKNVVRKISPHRDDDRLSCRKLTEIGRAIQPTSGN